MNQPLYRRLADELRAAIATGAYPIGAQLPTEHELCATHNVSRHTAREALRMLRDAGLIARRRGRGTQVIAPQPAPAFSQTLGGLDDLLQYARDARLEVRYLTALPATSMEPGAIGLDPSQSWVRLDGLRRRASDARPIALTRIYLRADICPPRAAIDSWSGALNELIAKNAGVVTTRIDQEIAAVALSRVEARMLEADAGAPALKTTRRYHEDADRIFQASVSLHPGDRFVYAMSVASG